MGMEGGWQSRAWACGAQLNNVSGSPPSRRNVSIQVWYRSLDIIKREEEQENGIGYES